MKAQKFSYIHDRFYQNNKLFYIFYLIVFGRIFKLINALYAILKISSSSPYSKNLSSKSSLILFLH